MSEQDPHTLRSKAEFCLRLAARIDRPQTAEHLRTAATRYAAQANEIEQHSTHPESADAKSH